MLLPLIYHLFIGFSLLESNPPYLFSVIPYLVILFALAIILSPILLSANGHWALFFIGSAVMTVLSLITEANQLSTDGESTPMSLERARSIHLELAKHFITTAGNLEHVIWEMGGHRSLRYNPGLDPRKIETENKKVWKHVDE